jgi:hypothetical protein
MHQSRCPLCRPEKSRIILENEAATAFPDPFPVAEGHTLVVPRRHLSCLFDLPAAEQAALWGLVAQVRAKLLEELRPDGSNVRPHARAAPRPAAAAVSAGTLSAPGLFSREILVIVLSPG